MPFKLNVFTGTFDIVGDLTQGLADLRYLKLDQTTPQTTTGDWSETMGTVVDGGKATSRFSKIGEVMTSALLKCGVAGDTYNDSQKVSGGSA